MSEVTLYMHLEFKNMHLEFKVSLPIERHRGGKHRLLNATHTRGKLER
jgi:hypothetical protein